MNKYRILLILYFIGLILSGIHPHDYFTWILEVFPGIIGELFVRLEIVKRGNWLPLLAETKSHSHYCRMGFYEEQEVGRRL